MKTTIKTTLIGIGATFATDIWSFFLKFCGIQSHGLYLVGNWIVSKLDNLLKINLSGSELTLGWIAHYCLGISFAFLLISIYGKEWLKSQPKKQTFFFLLISLLISLLIIQPILGFGIAFSKMPNQSLIILKVVAFHIIYCIGLNLSAKTLLIKLKNSTRV